MKRLAVSITLLICFVTALMAANGSAGKGIKWELKKGVLTISGNGPMKNFRKERPWIAENVEKLVVEEGVTTIGDNLCRGSGNLTYVSLPSSLKTIGNSAFQSCSNLPDIHLPYGVEEIGDRAFYDCNAFIEIDIPISMKRIGKEAFAKCSNISTARLTQGLESVGEKAFEECRILTNLSGLPNFIDTDNSILYGLNRAAVKNFWDRKEEMAAKYGNASGTNVTTKSDYAKVEPSDVDKDIPFTGKST